MFPVVLLLVHDCTSQVNALDECLAPYMVDQDGHQDCESTVHIPFDDVIGSVKL